MTRRRAASTRAFGASAGGVFAVRERRVREGHCFARAPRDGDPGQLADRGRRADPSLTTHSVSPAWKRPARLVASSSQRLHVFTRLRPQRALRAPGVPLDGIQRAPSVRTAAQRPHMNRSRLTQGVLQTADDHALQEPDASPPPQRTRPTSQIHVRPPQVLLVCLEPGEEPTELGIQDLPVRVLRVRHPLPACTRIRAVRPYAVIIGSRVKPWALPLLADAARDAGAEVLELTSLIARSALGSWVSGAIERVSLRRTEKVRESQGT